MAGWISSKLKAAETLLLQIDQQAAESHGKSPSASDLTALQPSSDPLLDVPPRRTPPAGPPPSLGLRLAVKRPSPSHPPPSPGPRRSASAAAVLDQAVGGAVEPVAEARAAPEEDRLVREVGKGGAPESGSESESDEDSDGSGSDDSEDSEEKKDGGRRRGDSGGLNGLRPWLHEPSPSERRPWRGLRGRRPVSRSYSPSVRRSRRRRLQSCRLV